LFLLRLLARELQGGELFGRVLVGLADLMSQGHLDEVTLQGKSYQYGEVLELIRFSDLPVLERAPFSYRQGLLQALTDPPARALLTLRQLVEEYPEGANAQLYQETYEQLLYQTVTDFFEAERYWDMDQIYMLHRRFLENNLDTRYAHMMARAYLALGLTAPAREVFEALWQVKQKTEGFELAYERPFIDYLLLLNDLLLDDLLKTRLAFYEQTYGFEGRFPSELLYVLSDYELRTLPAEEVVLKAKERPLFLKNRYDAKRLQVLLIAAQEAQDLMFAYALFTNAANWPQLSQWLPELTQVAEIHMADTLFRSGNYQEAETRYRRIQQDDSVPLEDRIWADLQVARLLELKGASRLSLPLYGRVLFNETEAPDFYRQFARRRLHALSWEKEQMAF
jgi:hypothetical protein